MQSVFFHKKTPTFSPSGSTERKDERRAQQAAVGHRGPPPHRVQRASAAPPQRADGGPRGEGCRWFPRRCEGVRDSSHSCLSPLQNMLIQDSDGYRKQYEESLHEKVGDLSFHFKAFFDLNN